MGNLPVLIVFYCFLAVVPGPRSFRQAIGSSPRSPPGQLGWLKTGYVCGYRAGSVGRGSSRWTERATELMVADEREAHLRNSSSASAAQ